MSKLIIEEPPLQVLPSLAIRIGLNEAIVLQQLHYLLRQPKFGRRIAEHQWIFNTYEEWQCQYFPFWHRNTIKNIFTSLSKQGLILCCQPEGKVSRRKYYRINTEELSRISEQPKFGRSNDQSLPDQTAKVGSFLGTETTGAETTVQRGLKKTKETASVEAASKVFEAKWKPVRGTKEEQLAAIEPPMNFYSETEFDNLLEEEGMDHLGMGKHFDLYRELCLKKWHHWDGRRWRPIRDVVKYLRGLETKIETATAGGF